MNDLKRIYNNDGTFSDVLLTDAEQGEVEIARATTIAQMTKDAITKALIETDMVANRCWKAGVPFPNEWQSYTIDLRSGVLPTKPAFPPNT